MVGCGSTTDDPNFKQLTDWYSGCGLIANKHHFFIHQMGRLSTRPPDWLEAIPFGDSYDALVPFLEELLRDAEALRASEHVLARSCLDLGSAGLIAEQGETLRYAHHSARSEAASCDSC